MPQRQMTQERLVETIPLADRIDDAGGWRQIQQHRAGPDLQRRIDEQDVIGMPERETTGDVDRKGRLSDSPLVAEKCRDTPLRRRHRARQARE